MYGVQPYSTSGPVMGLFGFGCDGVTRGRRSGPHRQPVVFLGHPDEAGDQSRRPLALGD